MSDDRIETAIQLRESGLSVNQIAWKLGDAPNTWSYRLLSRGIERGGDRVRFRPDERPYDTEIERLRLAGTSIKQIARRIGKAKSYVQARLQRIARRQAWDEENV